MGPSDMQSRATRHVTLPPWDWITAFAACAQRGGAASSAFGRKENPFRNREIAGAGLDLSPRLAGADRALATDTHPPGRDRGLYSSARFAGCALRRYTFGRGTTFPARKRPKPFRKLDGVSWVRWGAIW